MCCFCTKQEAHDPKSWERHENWLLSHGASIKSLLTRIESVEASTNQLWVTTSQMGDAVARHEEWKPGVSSSIRTLLSRVEKLENLNAMESWLLSEQEAIQGPQDSEPVSREEFDNLKLQASLDRDANQRLRATVYSLKRDLEWQEIQNKRLQRQLSTVNAALDQMQSDIAFLLHSPKED